MRRYDNSGPRITYNHGGGGGGGMNFNQGGGGGGGGRNFDNNTSSLMTKNQRKRYGKRQRMEDEEAEENKRTSTTAAQQHSEDLCIVLCDDNSCNGKSVLAVWTNIESKLSELVMEHALASTDSDKTPAKLPTYDTCQLYRGYKQLKCNDELSKQFLLDAVTKLSDAFEGVKLTAVAINDLPPRPRAVLWLPKIQPTWTKILATLLLQNPSVPMDDWNIQKIDELSNSLAVHLFISEESIEPLKKLGNQLYFGVRHAKLKVIPISQPDKPTKEETLDTAELSE